jgi:hypothetical protein
MVACSGGADDEPTVEPTEESPPVESTSTAESPPIETATPASPSYPAPPTPTPPGVDDGYPVYTPAPTYDPYPGGLATIVRPMGLQCEEPVFPDLSAAIGSLEDAGIVVVAAEEVALNVCDGCGCATSEHFRMQINAEDLGKALDMGWLR